jgi:sugar phosphate isomerase/epimerase
VSQTQSANQGPVDAGKAIGMTVLYASVDLEQAVLQLTQAQFEGAEVFVSHLGPSAPPAPVLEAHAVAAGDLLRQYGLVVSTLNCTVGFFDPFSSDEALERTAAGLAWNLRLGAAIGSPRVLIWDGELDDPPLLKAAPSRLTQMIDRGRELSRLSQLPDVAVELHPNTFALKHGRHEETADALVSVGAGVCLDFCHAGVALGPDFARGLSDSFWRSVTHVHWADSDCSSEQLHFPPGAGRVDIGAAEDALAERGIGVAWDLFGWPGPRAATAAGMARYRAGVAKIAGPKITGTKNTRTDSAPGDGPAAHEAAGDTSGKAIG